jgi:tetratricopeptide (TPR) repeat protein
MKMLFPLASAPPHPISRWANRHSRRCDWRSEGECAAFLELARPSSKIHNKRDQGCGIATKSGRRFMSLRVLICLFLLRAAPAPAAAAPFIPESDSQVLERLPFAPGDPVMRKLRALNDQLTRTPDDLPLATLVAQGYAELGRVTGDPRYAGYAQAALAPWWGIERPPQEVLVLRAALRQRMHQFDLALADLATVLSTNPRNVQARLMRATVQQVQGAYDEAREECRALQDLTQELIWTACLANVNGVTGKLRQSYAQLLSVFARYPVAEPKLRSWVLTSLAEMATRAGMMPEAEAHFRAALALGPADYYLLGAYADYLLDNGRPEEVLAPLHDKTAADPLLLRYALALQAEHSKELPANVEQLRDRFAASRLRGDRVHLREEARFTLHLLNAPQETLKLALENWQVQKEPADIRILLEAALAANDAAAIAVVTDWLENCRTEDVQLSRLMPAGKDRG